MEQVDTNTNDTATCNTKERSRCWGPCTWNNYSPIEMEELRVFCETECEDFAINQEIGESGTPHLQFFMKFKNAREFGALKKRLPKCYLCKTRSWDKAKAYCLKSETAICPPIVPEGTRIRRPLKDPLEGKELRRFQSMLINLVNSEPDDRTINWVYDPVGNAGKTSLTKHLCMKRPGDILYLCNGKASDLKYGIYKFLENDKNDLYAVFIDLTRSIENYVSYEAIESVKNGIFYNTKYESGMLIFNPPHVVILANFMPDLPMLSMDRWNIIDLSTDM